MALNMLSPDSYLTPPPTTGIGPRTESLNQCDSEGLKQEKMVKVKSQAMV